MAYKYYSLKVSAKLLLAQQWIKSQQNMLLPIPYTLSPTVKQIANYGTVVHYSLYNSYRHNLYTVLHLCHAATITFT